MPYDQITIVSELRRAGAPAGFAYEHVAAKFEPVLWSADATAWAFGAGSDWRRRIEGVIEETRTMP